MISKTAHPAAAASGFPPNVEACVPGFRCSATSGLAASAPMAVPPPNCFAIVMMSGSTPGT